jgi:integrase
MLIAYTALGLFAGLRPAEIGRLEANHINLETGTILVRGKVRNANGLRSQRLVPIEPGLKSILGLLDLAKQIFVVDASGHSRLMWATICSTAQLLESWDPDCMRHSYCSYRLARGDSIEAVSRDAGNSPVTLTKYYLHPRTRNEALEYWAIDSIRRKNAGNQPAASHAHCYE